MDRLHRGLIVAFAALLALTEGPAQIACVAVVLTTLITGRWRNLRLGPVEVGVIVYVLAGLPGLLTVDVPRTSEATLKPLMALAFIVGAAAVEPEDDRQLGRLAWVFGAVLALNGAYGYLQTAFGALPLDEWLLMNPRSSQIFAPGNWDFRLASGLYYNRLKLAHVGIVGLALYALTFTRSRPWRKLTIAFALLGLAVLGGAIVLAYARMALVALVVGAGVVLLVMARRGGVIAAGGIAFALAGGLALTRFGAKRLESLGGDLEVRRAMLESGWRVFVDHPVFGVGHGGYKAVARSYMDAGHVGVRLTSPHNLALQVLDETGLVGFAGFATALVGGLWIVARRVRASRVHGSAAAVADRLALFTLVAYAVLGLTHFTIHHAPVAMTFWALLGVAAGARRVSS